MHFIFIKVAELFLSLKVSNKLLQNFYPNSYSFSSVKQRPISNNTFSFNSRIFFSSDYPTIV